MPDDHGLKHVALERNSSVVLDEILPICIPKINVLNSEGTS
jgi:hypothetical protein